MAKLIKSEAIKLKNRLELYISIIFAIASTIIVFLIFSSKTKIDLASRMDIQISLVLMMISLNTLFLTRQGCLMEKKANKFQNILSFKKPHKLWNCKVFLIVLIQFALFGFAEIVGLIMVKQFLVLNKVLVGILIHSLLSTNIHMYIQARHGDYPNVIVGIFEIILIIFSTNIPMENWYLFPSCYGYKIYENFNSVSIEKWLIVLIVILASVLINTLLVIKNKFNYK